MYKEVILDILIYFFSFLIDLQRRKARGGKRLGTK